MQKGALGIALPFVFVFGLILSLLLVIGGGAGANACTSSSSGNGGNSHQNASAPAAAPVTSIGDRGDTIKEYLPELKEASSLSGFPISLIAATIHQESGWDPNAVSGVGAHRDWLSSCPEPGPPMAATVTPSTPATQSEQWVAIWATSSESFVIPA